MTEAIKMIQAIFVKPGEDPVMCNLPVAVNLQTEAISDLLEGNFGATEFFDIGNGASLFILTNDLSIPLGLKPNRRFPGKDEQEIIFGNAIFIAAYNESSGKEGTVDMPERICRMFIEQIKLNFVPCRGDEKANSRAEVYIENEGTEEERTYQWHEVEKPVNIEQYQYLQVGRARWIQCAEQEVLAINDRYFRQVVVRTEKTPLN